MRSSRIICSRYASMFFASVCPGPASKVPAIRSGSPSNLPSSSSSSDTSGGWTASTVNGPVTRTTPFTSSGWLTNSSCSALPPMQAFTSSIFARHALRYSVTASWSAFGQSGSVSNGTSQCCHSFFGSSHRRRSASVIGLLPFVLLLIPQLVGELLPQRRRDLFQRRVQLVQTRRKDRLVLCENRIQRRVPGDALQRDMRHRLALGTRICRTVLPAGSVSQVPFGFRSRSSAASGRSW